MTEIKVGDVLQVRGLSCPRMAVVEIEGPERIFCKWFDQHGCLQQGVFPLRLLMEKTDD